mmetsp:Transcript_2245/g.5248  ORF Transcript_2245/g.5248 Transcript_2245/m.5248 type:complete len:199 (+) Transcript_2245:215-811(+)
MEELLAKRRSLVEQTEAYYKELEAMESQEAALRSQMGRRQELRAAHPHFVEPLQPTYDWLVSDIAALETGLASLAETVEKARQDLEWTQADHTQHQQQLEQLTLQKAELEKEVKEVELEVSQQRSALELRSRAASVPVAMPPVRRREEVVCRMGASLVEKELRAVESLKTYRDNLRDDVALLRKQLPDEDKLTKAARQ